MQKVPTQKSIVSSATMSLLNHITQSEPRPQMTETEAIALPEEMPSASSKNVFTGCSIEIELVMAARKRRKNQANPIQRPTRPFAQRPPAMFGSRARSRRRRRWRPRKTNAAVIVMSPPKPTSKSSLVELAVKPGERDVVLLLQIRGVVQDHAEPDRQTEENLPGRGQPGFEIARAWKNPGSTCNPRPFKTFCSGQAGLGVPRVSTRIRHDRPRARPSPEARTGRTFRCRLSGRDRPGRC